MFDDEIPASWCLGATFRCTVAESVGLFAAVTFYSTLIVVTLIHSVIQGQRGTAERNEEATRRHARKPDGDDLGFQLCLLVVYFFSFAGGSLAWALGGVTTVHPFQCWWLQLAGSALLLACALGFVAVHVNMGSSWSPEADQKAVHHLVTHGTFAWARHPMYAIFLWASVGTLLSTLNWLVAWIVTGLVFVTLRRIETEERILISLFGAEYLEYMRTVSALGPPWGCLGFDRGAHASGRLLR